MMRREKPELLAPAGDWPSLRAAVENGADSVYFGVKGLNMRHLASNFDVLELPKIAEYLHQNGKKGYVTLNTIFLPDDLPRAKRVLDGIQAAHLDAVICWDASVIAMARERAIPIHISTQASVANVEALKFYAQLGARRVVLARECTLNDIASIIRQRDQQGFACEIEVFVHGAMCVSISGRCFLSQYSHGKSANKGQCFQPCRREYRIVDVENEVEYDLGKDYVLSPKDLCTIDFIDQILDAGVDSLKIEGRMRSPEYIKVVTSCYAQAIDMCHSPQWDEAMRMYLKDQLRNVYNRGFSTGFYFGQPQEWNAKQLEHLYEKIYIGEVTRFFKQINVAEVKIRTGELKKGDSLIIIGKSTPAEFMVVESMQKDHQFVVSAKKGDVVGLKAPFLVKPKDKIFLWRKRNQQ